MKADEGGLVILGGSRPERPSPSDPLAARGRDSDRDLADTVTPPEADTRIERRR